jgi:hypothetical protein
MQSEQRARSALEGWKARRFSARTSGQYSQCLLLWPSSRSLKVPFARAAGLHSMLCARSSRTLSSTLRSDADCPLPLLPPVVATVSETTKCHHARPAERADEVTYGGDEARGAVCNYCKRSHNVSPYVAILHRRMHRTLSGAASAFGEECSLDGLRPLASDSSMRATEWPKFLTRN